MLTDSRNATLILVVEDDCSQLELIQRLFDADQEEYRLEIAGTLLEAWKVIERHTPDIILTDYRLPDGDGSELVVMVNEACPVILMTAQGNEQLAVQAMKIGAQDYIVKSPEVFAQLPRIVKLTLKTWVLLESRRQVENANLRAKKDWERTFNAVPDLISIIDPNHVITRANKAMADRCGLTPDELVGRKCCEIVHGLNHSPDCCPVAAMMQDGLVHSSEIEEKSLDGVFDVTVSPLSDDDGTITAYVHVMRDITELKLAEEERQKLEKQYQQTQRLESLGVLAGGIAHDFNNILSIILGHCYMVMENFDSGMTEREHVRHIEAAGNRAAELCRQMLVYAGQGSQSHTRVNLWLLVDEVVKMLTSALKKNVAIKLDLKRDVPEIIGDNAQIQQIVMNLIINAAEAIGDKKGTIKVALRKTIIQAEGSETDFMGYAIPAGRYACLEVSDTGCGIDEETKKRMFEPFFTTKLAGRGLGMSAVLGIIKSHEGALQLTSAPGAGAIFKVFFPLSAAPETVETVPNVGLLPLAKCSGTVLLVDDEEALCIIGSALLNAMGFSTVTASNGREALEIFSQRNSRIDMILLDLIMPEMGGLETYHLLRDASPAVPIIFCSGYNLEDVSVVVESDRNSAVVQKPYMPDQLREVMAKMMGSDDRLPEAGLPDQADSDSPAGDIFSPVL